MTTFDHLDYAMDELRFMVEETRKTHLIKHAPGGRYKVIQEYANASTDGLVARLSPPRPDSHIHNGIRP